MSDASWKTEAKIQSIRLHVWTAAGYASQQTLKKRRQEDQEFKASEGTTTQQAKQTTQKCELMAFCIQQGNRPGAGLYSSPTFLSPKCGAFCYIFGNLKY